MKKFLALSLGTGFGAGFIPIAPGTFGTLVGLPILYASLFMSVELRILFWLCYFALGVWSAKKIDEIYQTGDNQKIVVDEILGVALAGALLHFESSRVEWFTVFVLFRFFDITKIPPVRQMDQWSKKQSKLYPGGWWGGLGVILDDVLAGIQALAVFALLQGSVLSKLL